MNLKQALEDWIGADEPAEHTGPATVSLPNHRNWVREDKDR